MSGKPVAEQENLYAASSGLCRDINVKKKIFTTLF
jgi:hypothetical protein